MVRVAALTAVVPFEYLAAQLAHETFHLQADQGRGHAPSRKASPHDEGIDVQRPFAKDVKDLPFGRRQRGRGRAYHLFGRTSPAKLWEQLAQDVLPGFHKLGPSLDESITPLAIPSVNPTGNCKDLAPLL